MYCPNPFNRLEIKSNGDAYCCCEGWLPKPLGNVLEQDLMEIWHNTSAKEIRHSVLDGSFRYCRACPYLPGPKGPVVRDAPLRPDAERIKTLKLDYDQSCNLTCPSCRVTHSRNFVDVPLVTRIHEAVMSSRVLDHVDRLYVTGAGDPFASPLYWNFLKTLPELPQNPTLEIFLHTNGLLCDESHWAELGRNQQRVTEIGISVDAATATTYKTNRQGSWNKLWDNVDFINRLQTSGKKLMLGMFYTVQANNFREVIPFTRLAFGHRVSWISITALRNWGTYTTADYLSRAVHLPDHPDYAEFRQVIENEVLTRDPRIVLDNFNPAHTHQDVICNPEALLSASHLKR
jgi:radical SAM protein with 4Fe4S-binding SPASM domain